MAEELKNHDLIHRKSRYEYLEEETRFIQNQTHLALKKNAVESFAYLKSKADTCRKYKHLVKLVYGGIEEFIKKRKTEIRRDFDDKEDYIGGGYISRELQGTFLMRALRNKFPKVENYIEGKEMVFEAYENELRTRQLELVPVRTVDAIQEYLEEMNKLHKTVDIIQNIYQKIHKRAMMCRNAIILADSIKYDDMIKAGRKDEISGLPITAIELFKDEEILTLKVKAEGREKPKQLEITLEASKLPIELSLMALSLSEQ